MTLHPIHTFRIRVLLPALAATTLSGCFLNPDTLPPNQVVPTHQLYNSLLRLAPAVVEPQAETITLIHKTNFAYGDDELNDNEVARLTKFLQDTGADRLTRIEVNGPRKAAGKHDLLTAARLASISERLSDLGLNPTIAARPIDSMTVPSDAVVVTVTRAMVIEPDCEVPKTIYGPRPTHIWSCASTAVLGKMIVDPLDLERGRPQGPGDGEALAPGMARYRAGKITPIKNQSATGSE
jgi:type IV pilus biogenesis protein CpaD/CtpE